MQQNPFEKLEDPTQPYVNFLSGIPEITSIHDFKTTDFKEDRLFIIDKTMSITYTNPGGNSKLTNAIIERKLKVPTTTRN